MCIRDSASGLQDAVSEALKKLSDGGVLKLIDQKWLGEQMNLSSLTVIEPIPEPEPEPAEGEDTATTNEDSND